MVNISIHPGDGAGLLRGLFATAPPAVSSARADADGYLGGAAAAAAMYFLAVPGLPARQRGRATAGGAAVPAAASLGSGQREVERRGSGYRYDGTHAVRQSDGSAQRVQPEEQRQEEFSAYVQRRLVYSVGVNPTRTKVRVL